MPVSGSGGVVCSWFLLFTAIIAVVRQKFHLSYCADFRNRLYCDLCLGGTKTPVHEPNNVFLRSLVTGRQASLKRKTEMHNLILSAASALALASPAVASDLPVTSYSESYARSYEYRTSPPVVVEESAPVVSEILVVRRP